MIERFTVAGRGIAYLSLLPASRSAIRLFRREESSTPQATALRPGCSQSPSARPGNASSRTMLSLLSRMRAEAQRKSITVADFFVDYDPLRSGTIQRASLMRALTARYDLSIPEAEAIADQYPHPSLTDAQGRPLCGYRALVDNLDGIIRRLEADPTADVEGQLAGMFANDMVLDPFDRLNSAEETQLRSLRPGPRSASRRTGSSCTPSSRTSTERAGRRSPRSQFRRAMTMIMGKGLRATPTS